METKTLPKHHNSNDLDSLSLNYCRYCNRSFNRDSLNKHQNICYKQHLENECKKLNKRKFYAPTTITTKNNDTIKLSDILQQKYSRRHEWRKDHISFINELQSVQSFHGRSETMVPISFNNILDPPNETQYKEQLQISKNKNELIKNRCLETIEKSNCVKESGDEQCTMNPGNCSYEYKSSKTNLSPQLRDIVHISLECKHKHLGSVNNLSKNIEKRNCLKPFQKNEDSELVKYKSSIELNQINNSKSQYQNPSRYLSHISNLNENSPESYEGLNQEESTFPDEHFSHYPETRRYEEQINKVLQHYSENYWSTDNKVKQNVLDDIPKNLSVHRFKLEKLKQFNMKNNYTDVVHKTNVESKGKGFYRYRNLNLDETESFNENSRFSNRNKMFAYKAASLSNISCQNVSSTPEFSDHNGLKNLSACKVIMKSTSASSNDECYESSPKPILRKIRSELVINHENKVIPRNENFVNKDLDRFKKHQKEIVDLNMDLTYKIKNRIPEKTTKKVTLPKEDNNENSVLHEKGDSKNIVTDSVKRQEINKFVSQPPMNIRKSSNKTMVDIDERFQTLPPSSPPYQRDDDYIQAWHVQL